MTDYKIRTEALYMAMLGLNWTQQTGKDPYKELNIKDKLKEYVNEILGIFHKFISGEISYKDWENEYEKFLMAADTRIETPVLNNYFKSVKLPIITLNKMDDSKEQLNKKVTLKSRF